MGAHCAGEQQGHPHEAQAQEHLDMHFEESWATTQLVALLKQANQDIFKMPTQHPITVNLGMIMVQCNRDSRYIRPVTSGAKFSDRDTLMKAARYMKYARAAYATSQLEFSNRFFGEEDDDGRSFELLHAHISNKPDECPSFFITSDKASTDIVLSISGGNSLESAMSAAVAEPEDFMGGIVNASIWTDSQQVIIHAKQPLESALKKSPQSALAIVGHSTGAGVATLIMLQGFGDDSVVSGMLTKGKAKCFAFGSPPVFQPVQTPLPAHLTSAVCGFVNGMDCIPRFSRNTIGKLLMAVKKVDELEMGAAERVQYLREGEPTVEKLPDNMEVPEEISAEVPSLSPIGTTLLLFKQADGSMVCKKAQPAAPDKVLIHENMFKDHSLDAYEESITELLMQMPQSRGCC